MTEAEKNIPERILDKNYTMGLFDERIRDIDPSGKSIACLDSYKIKGHFNADFFHYVIQHNLTLNTHDGLRRRYKIYCAAFSAHGRRKMYQTLKLIYANGFAKGAVIVPRPLWYIDEIMAVFYVGVVGENFLEHIKNGALSFDALKRIGNGLRQLHTISVADLTFLPQHSFSYKYLDPTNILSRAHNKDQALTVNVRNQFARIKRRQSLLAADSLCLVHGDFHPENVIVSKFKDRQVAFIDFSESCLAPICYDLGSFLEQFEFMTRDYITASDYLRAERKFLAGYFNAVEVSPEIMAQINLYKAWTALKSTVYFMIYTDEINRGFAGFLFDKSKEFLSRTS